MSAIGSNIMSIARTAIHAHQLAVQVTANNISNAQTEGYSRQRALITSADPARVHPGWMGRGVVVVDVNRVRDSLLDTSVRREGANASSFGVRRDMLAQVESVLGEPSETGLASALDAFWSSWSDLANQPTSGSAKSAVQQNGARVASTLNGFDRRLGELGDSAWTQFDASVKELNGLLKQVAELNERILSAEVGGNSAPDLRDARDRAVDGIGRIAGVQVIEQQDRSYGIVIGGANVVDGNTARTLSAEAQRDSQGRVIGFSLNERSQSLVAPGGRLEGLIQTADDIRDVRTRLDAFAGALVEHVNDTYGDPPFFDPAGQNARSVGLSEHVRTSPDSIRAGSDGGNEIALGLAEFRDRPFPLSFNGDPDAPGRSFADFYRDIVSGVAFKATDAERSATAAETLATQAETRRESMSGVSIDEELILLMRHQQAYTAASRLIKVADEMMQTVLQLV